jgi:hypothetical protein
MEHVKFASNEKNMFNLGVTFLPLGQGKQIIDVFNKINEKSM